MSPFKKCFRSVFFVAAFVAVCALTESQAAVVLELNEVYTGATPSGTAPWLTATFTDGLGGTVLLTLEANLQAATEFFKTVAFNYSGPATLQAVVPANVTFISGHPSDVSGGSVGTFDFGFGFETSNSGGGALRFNNSDILNITLSSTGGPINSSMFNVATNPGGFFAAAHVNGIATAPGSGKIGDDTPQPSPGPVIPEPGTMTLLALGAIGLGGHRWRQAKAKPAA